MEGCTPKCVASKLLVLGAILILVRLYTTWDMWIVIGTILVIKAIILFIIPGCKCQTQAPKKK